MENEKRFVVVTTDKNHQGVFGGYLESESGDVVELSTAYMAVYWSSETKSVLGLASIGPQDGSRISPPVPKIKINCVTSIIDCTKEAQEKWISQPWG